MVEGGNAGSMLGLEELEVDNVVIRGDVGWESGLGLIFFVSASILDARGHGKSNRSCDSLGCHHELCLVGRVRERRWEGRVLGAQGVTSQGASVVGGKSIGSIKLSPHSTLHEIRAPISTRWEHEK